MLKVFKRFRKETPQDRGLSLEKRVVRLFRNQGKWNVKHDVKLHDRNGNLSQIDVTYGLFFPTYIECKSYENKPVPLEDVAKFKEVLSLNGISLNRGLFITTSTYTPRATTIGIKTIDGNQLEALELRSKVFKFVRWMFWIGYLVLILYFWPEFSEIVGGVKKMMESNKWKFN